MQSEVTKVALAWCVTGEDHLLAQEYVTPEGKMLSRDLTHQLNTAIQFLVECRPLSVSMGNAIKFVKLQVRLQPLQFWTLLCPLVR